MDRILLGSCIRTMRTQKHLTQSQLADRLGVTDKAVSKWERGLSFPDISMFPGLAEELGISVTDLLECADEGQPSRLVRVFEMTHDIRTPLHIILGCADMAEAHMDDAGLLRRYLDSIRVSGKYLLSVMEKAACTSGNVPEEDSQRQFPETISELDEYLKEPGLPETPHSKIPDFSGKRILVAEDMELNREIAAEILRQTGAETEFAQDGLVCLHMVASAPPGHYDLVLMDIRMPNMDGIETTRRIRALDDKTRANLPIIAMTANTARKDRSEAFLAGMNGFTEKPVQRDRLYAIMQQFL